MKIGNSIITPSWGDILIWKNKSFECKLICTRNSDHAGISFTFGHRKLFWMNFNIHDRRHWHH